MLCNRLQSVGWLLSCDGLARTLEAGVQVDWGGRVSTSTSPSAVFPDGVDEKFEPGDGEDHLSGVFAVWRDTDN